jgi:hypothetical protein
MLVEFFGTTVSRERPSPNLVLVGIFATQACPTYLTCLAIKGGSAYGVQHASRTACKYGLWVLLSVVGACIGDPMPLKQCCSTQLTAREGTQRWASVAECAHQFCSAHLFCLLPIARWAARCDKRAQPVHTPFLGCGWGVQQAAQLETWR